MKKLTLILLFLIMNYSCNAQQPILRTLSFQETLNDDYLYKQGDYVKDVYNELNPYIGLWKYEGSEKTLILKIQKVNLFYNSISKTYADELLVTYKYIKNGSVIVDNINAPIIANYDYLSSSDKKKYGTFGITTYLNETFLTGSIRDIPLNILTSAEIHPIDFGMVGSTPKIRIYYNGLNSLKGNPDSFYQGKPAFEIPNDVILLKQ